MATVSGGVSRPAQSWRKGVLGELWAEFFGCFILISFGDGVVAMLWALFGSGRTTPAGGLQSGGDWLLIGWGWAMAVTVAVYTVGGITGAHINPAVTLGAAIRKNLPWSKVPRYWAAQVLGCFVGAALVYLVYNAAINHYDTTHHIVKGTLAWRALDAVQARGKARADDKTMVDALLPAVAALEQATDLHGGLRAAADAAREGMLATTPLVARTGRASYLGERSAGHQDPGATSTYYLFESAAEALTG